MAVRVEVWGKYALFSRPEMKTERCTYDVMTASAARGVLDAIYYHPGLRWIVDKVHVLKPIRFTNVRRNEVSAKMSSSNAMTKANNPEADFFMVMVDNIQQRASLVLQDVHYVIEAHFEMTDKANASDNPGKFQDIMTRRLAKGQCYHTPYLGCREFAAHFRPWSDENIPAIPETRDLGFMLLDLDYRDMENIRPIFHRAQMNQGVVEYPDPVAWYMNHDGEVVR